MANRMGDTNEQNRDDGNEKSKEDYPLVQEDPKATYHYNAKKCIKWTVSVCMILMMVAVVWALVAFPSLPSNFTKPSSSPESSANKSDKTKAIDKTCAYITDREYWKSIPDNLDEYCRPKQVMEGTSGYLKKRVQCPGTQLYIPPLCVCDYNVTCPKTKNSLASQTEHYMYMKRPCKECTSQEYCACQNFGKCYNCTEKIMKSWKCLCKPGTDGTYCTKISKRLCTKSKESNGLESCSNSNNLECVLRLDNHDIYVCKWNEAMNGDYPNCGLSVSTSNLMKGGMSSSEEMHNSETPQLTTTNMLLWAIFVLLVVAFIGLSILQFYGTCQTFIKTRCEKCHSLMQSCSFL